jgi:membrane-bound lytic murein transglycosylase D
MNLFKITTTVITFLLVITIYAQKTQDTITLASIDSINIIAEAEDTLKQASIITEIDTTGEFNLLIKDSQVLITLDDLLYNKFYKKRFFTIDTAGKFNQEFEFDEIPVYADSIYDRRIKELNRNTPIELTYNKEVKSFINLYAVKKRELTSKMLGLAEIYFPMFEEALDKYDMPLEIKYLAIVESALNPSAGSNMGAKGLWQFMYGTGKVYGLKVTSLVDDRYDPYQSTIAACEHLTDLYDIYNDWSLALAAYNSGAGNVNRAIRRAGGTKNYWAVWPFLPRETRGYVPAFIAVNYVMNHASEHNIYPTRPGIFYYDIDTVTVRDVLAFDQLNEMIGIPMDELEFMNPQFKKGIIPATAEKEYTIRIPRNYVADFLNNEEQLYAYKTKKGIERDNLLAEIKKAKDRNVHIVRSGESLGLIAKRNHVYVNQIKRWNNLKSNTIYPGQKLVLYGSGSNEYYQKSTPVVRSSEKSDHLVKNGENLGLIAAKYKCTVTDLKEWNNLGSSKIFPNQKLIVYKPDNKPSSIVKDGKYLYHTIRKGDTLWDIAKEYDGVTVEKIKSLNNIKNSKRLVPGQKIKIAVIS